VSALHFGLLHQGAISFLAIDRLYSITFQSDINAFGLLALPVLPEDVCLESKRPELIANSENSGFPKALLQRRAKENNLFCAGWTLGFDTPRPPGVFGLRSLDSRRRRTASSAPAGIADGRLTNPFISLRRFRSLV
jgi:hypothetical protein